MRYIAPSAPAMYPPQPQYTYATMPQQQQQAYAYYQSPYVVHQQQQYQQQQYQQQQHPQQQQGIGLGTAMLGGFVLGAVVDDIFDPTE